MNKSQHYIVRNCSGACGRSSEMDSVETMQPPASTNILSHSHSDIIKTKVF